MNCARRITSCPQDKAWSTWHATITSLAWSLSEYVMTWQSGLTHTAGCPLPVSPVAAAGPPGPRHVEAPNLPFSLPALPDQDFDISTCSPSLSLSSASPCPLKTSATSSYWCGSWEQSGSIMDTWQRHRATAQSVWPSADRPHGQLWLQNERSFHSFTWISQGSKIIWIIP